MTAMSRLDAYRELRRKEQIDWPSPVDEVTDIALAALADSVTRAEWEADAEGRGWMGGDSERDGHWRDHCRNLRAETALNEAATARLWAQLEPRYYVSIVVEDCGWRGQTYHGIWMQLFHEGDIADSLVAQLTVPNPGRMLADILESLVVGQIADTFSRRETRQLIRHFHKGDGIRGVKIRLAKPPQNHYLGNRDMAVGGPTDFIMLTKDPDYSLPFKVWAFVDMRQAWPEDAAEERAVAESTQERGI